MRVSRERGENAALRAPSIAKANVPEGIDVLPSGSFRVRVRLAGEQLTLGVERELGAAIVLLSEWREENCRGVTLRAWARLFFTRRERVGGRGGKVDRQRWAKHVAPSALGQTPLTEIRPADVRRFVYVLITTDAAWRYPGRRGVRPIARQTVKNVFYLVRAALRDACDAELLVANPSDGIRVPSLARVDDPWTYLLLAEIEALRAALERAVGCRATGARLLALVLVAIGTGLREGELRALRWRHVSPALDADAPILDVREGSPGRPTKSKSSKRRLPLFGVALDALRAWREVVGDDDPDAPIFATKRGTPFAKGALFDLDRLRAALTAAGIERNVRVHDLRHTAAAALVSGFWGRAWSLEEVRLFLGHGTVAMTERYAHLAPGVLERAARETMALAARRRGDGD